MSSIIEQIKEIVHACVGNECLYFSTPATLHLPLNDFNYWGACVSPTSQLYVMDNKQEWHPVAEKDETFMVPVLNQVRKEALKYQPATERSGDQCLRCGNPIDHNDPHLYCSNCN